MENPALTPRPLPAWSGKTYRDLAKFVIEVGEAQQACEIDKKAAAKVCE